MQIPRSRGAVSGLLLVVLGLWGAIIPFVGPYFDFTIGSSATWDWTWGRFWLSVLPGIAAILGGLTLMVAARRPSAVLGGWLGLLGGAWFVVGPTVSMAWNGGVPDSGLPLGDDGMRVLEWIGYFYALGAIITALSAFMIGRLSLRSARDVELERERTREREAAAMRERRFRREEHAPAGAAAAAGTIGGAAAERRTRVEAMDGETARHEPVGATAGGTSSTEPVTAATTRHEPAAGGASTAETRVTPAGDAAPATDAAPAGTRRPSETPDRPAAEPVTERRDAAPPAASERTMQDDAAAAGRGSDSGEPVTAPPQRRGGLLRRFRGH